MASARRAYRSKPHVFCYICGVNSLAMKRNLVTNFIKGAYHSYFSMKLGDQDKVWARPVCSSGVSLKESGVL